MDEDWKPEGILPPIAGWSCAYTSDENQGKPRAPEPPPVVTVTELSDWGMVLRASHGILNFQNAMDSILEEERRIVARFKQLVIATAHQQAVHEETVLWNFVRGCMPKLVNERFDRATFGATKKLSDMSANQLRIWSKEKKKKLKEFGRMYAALAKAAYNESQARALKERESNGKRKAGLSGGNFLVNFGLVDDVRMMQKIAQAMLQFSKRQFGTSQALLMFKKIDKVLYDLNKLLNSSNGRKTQTLRRLHVSFDNVISSLLNIAEEADDMENKSVEKFHEEYDHNLIRLAQEWQKQNSKEKRKTGGGRPMGNRYWQNARLGAGGANKTKALKWEKPPNVEYHWLDEAYLYGKMQQQDVKNMWAKLSTRKEYNFSLNELEEDLIVKEDYRYFKDLKSATDTKSKLDRRKALEHFRREFLSLWFTHDDFSNYATTFLKRNEEKIPKWSVRDIHKQLYIDYNNAFNNNNPQMLNYFNSICSIDKDDRMLYKIQLETFKKVLERSISDWDGKDPPEDMEDHHASDNEDGEDVKVDVMNPLVHQNDGRWPRFIGGASPADIKQGDANDCWLLSAMMIAAARDKDAEEKMAKQKKIIDKKDLIISNLFVNDDHSNVHVVQFYRPDTGKWEKVVVDNAVPVRPILISANKRPVKTNSKDGKKLPPPKPKPKYASSREPEMWVMLIEKAYAKWVSSRAKNEKFDTENPYDNINFGLIDEALVSFTGGVKSLIPLDTTEGQAEARSGKLWDHLVDYHSKGYLLGCSTPSGHDAFWDENGLVKGHAYAILSVVTTNPPAGSTSGSKMLLLRNPWGVNPWDFDPPARPSKDQPWPIHALDWSPRSDMWQGPGGQYMMRKLRVQENVAQDPGMFWITYEDFVRVYAAIFCCRVLKGWKKESLSSSWCDGQMGGVISGPGGFQNPQWRLKIKSPTAAYFCLSQTLSAKMKYIMLAVVANGKKLRKPVGPSEMKSPRFFHSGAPNDSREVGFDVRILPPGEYTLIASTFDPNQQTGCRLTIYLKDEKALDVFEEL